MKNFKDKKFKFDESSIDDLKNVVDVETEISADYDEDWGSETKQNYTDEPINIERISPEIDLKNLRFVLNECFPNVSYGFQNPAVQNLIIEQADLTLEDDSLLIVNDAQENDYIDVEADKIYIVYEDIENIPEDISDEEILEQYKNREQKLVQ